MPHSARFKRKPRSGFLSFLLGFVILILCSRIHSQKNRSAPIASAEGPDSLGNETCAPCHGDLYRSYMQTPMALASGLAADNLIPARFTHAPSGVEYDIVKKDGKAWLRFARPGDPMVRGQRELLYYIGQGRRGRTYLFAVNGFVFEAPVNWYAGHQTWDMPPAYASTHEIPMNLPAVTSCLGCHGSGIRPPLEGTENRYRSPMFAHPGVTCERCHGPGQAHIGGGPIINPAKLSPLLRDQVCMQCHLEGNVAIERIRKHLYDYQPGTNLFDYVHYFVWSGRSGENLRATSQFEALNESVCKRKSGDKLSCTSCHDPHRALTADQRVAYYRERCLACHGEGFARKHHHSQPDCTSCHMPRNASTDIAHTAVTDHRILRVPKNSSDASPASEATPRLVSFPPSQAHVDDARDLALAWQSLANAGIERGQREAKRWLRKALDESPNDPALLSAMAYIEQKSGATDNARQLYSKALEQDPELLDAATNLGVIEAREGHLEPALKLWQSAFDRAPGRSAIGMNLALSLCAARRYDEARDDVMRVLEFNPDLGAAKRLARELNRDPPDCSQ